MCGLGIWFGRAEMRMGWDDAGHLCVCMSMYNAHGRRGLVVELYL